MKSSQIGRFAVASVLSLAACIGLTACTTAYTGAYLYVTSVRANPGVVNAFKIDSVSGALTILPDSPFPAGRNPVGVVVSPDNKAVYVVNHDDSTVIEYLIGTDGKLYAQNTYNTTGGLPTSIAIDPTGKFLLIPFTYQLGYTTASPGPGGVDIFPINADESLVSTPSTGTSPGLQAINVGCNPVAINVSATNNYVYVLDQNYSPSPNTCVATPGNSPVSNTPLILGYSLNTSQTAQGGILTPLPGATIRGVSYPGYPAGVQPAGLISDPKGQYVYVTDETANAIYGYTIQANGSLVAMQSTPTGVAPIATTQLTPMGMTMSPDGRFLFNANYGSNNLSEFSIGSGGALTPVGASGTVGLGTNPTCLTMSSHGQFLFSTNYTSSNISALQLESTGQLINVGGMPFGAAGFPTCGTSVVAVGH